MQLITILYFAIIEDKFVNCKLNKIQLMLKTLPFIS